MSLKKIKILPSSTLDTLVKIIALKSLHLKYFFTYFKSPNTNHPCTPLVFIKLLYNILLDRREQNFTHCIDKILHKLP